MDGRLHHFGAIGIVNGLAVLADRETRSHWDHITGQAFAGPLKGRVLEAWPVRMTTAAAARQEQPGLTIFLSGHKGLQKNLAEALYPHFIHSPIWLPQPFYLSMTRPVDSRLGKMAQGLGVVVGARARYYPFARIPAEGLEDDWDGRILVIRRGAIDRVPRATWQDTGEIPMQLLSRWYGFSFTYPSCEIYGDPPPPG